MCCLVENEKAISQKWESLFHHPKRFQTRADEYVSEKLPSMVHGKFVRSKTGYLIVGGKRLVLVGAPETTNDLADEFQNLANQWKRDTLAISSVSEIVMHPAYQRIMSMGKQALPLILQQLRRELDHWFYALEFIAGTDGKDVAKGADTLEDARSAWLEWGYRHGYL
jgi:hypothetical protein